MPRELTDAIERYAMFRGEAMWKSGYRSTQSGTFEKQLYEDELTMWKKADEAFQELAKAARQSLRRARSSSEGTK